MFWLTNFVYTVFNPKTCNHFRVFSGVVLAIVASSKTFLYQWVLIKFPLSFSFSPQNLNAKAGWLFFLADFIVVVVVAGGVGGGWPVTRNWTVQPSSLPSSRSKNPGITLFVRPKTPWSISVMGVPGPEGVVPVNFIMMVCWNVSIKQSASNHAQSGWRAPAIDWVLGVRDGGSNFVRRSILLFCKILIWGFKWN